MKLTDAILEVLRRHGGAATLATFYTEIPNLDVQHDSQDYEKVIRGYLWRMKDRKDIKRIGLSTYALNGYEVENNLFREISEEKVEEQKFVSLPESQLHGHLQGMLIEIGNMRNFDTYTPDKNIVFNGKRLSEVSTIEKIPPFTYQDRVRKIAQIDVVWFRDGYPVKTFDVEHSTDFTKALVRSYQLKYFKTDCFMVADEKKKNVFADRIATHPFNEMKDNIQLLLNSSIFKDYQSMIQIQELKK